MKILKNNRRKNKLIKKLRKFNTEASENWRKGQRMKNEAIEVFNMCKSVLIAANCHIHIFYDEISIDFASYYPSSLYSRDKEKIRELLNKIELVNQLETEGLKIENLKEKINELLDYKAKYYQVISNMKI